MPSLTNHHNTRLALSLLATSVALAGRVFAAGDAAQPDRSFEQLVKPFLEKHCVRCHNPDKSKSGVRVDNLGAGLEDRQIKLWQAVRKQVETAVMPPEKEPQPSDAERGQIVAWIQRGLDAARARPTPKNGVIRRLTASQYRNTLRDLLDLEDDVANSLPPDAVSRDGFLNNQETQHLSPLLLEAYYAIAETALDRCIMDPATKPKIQNFRVDLGRAINPHPCPDNLILGADSLLLDNPDFVVTQLTPSKPFAFEPYFMQTKFRYIEGYAGNDTVRGWREYDSIYHAVFACMRGGRGYPKGHAYTTVPGGLLLRPAIPSAELFGIESTYGPKANFKISLRELPDDGRFRVTVTAAKYDDGLLLDKHDASVGADRDGSVICHDPETARSITLPKAGIYQVDVHTTNRMDTVPKPDPSRLSEALAGAWHLDGNAAGVPDPGAPPGRLSGETRFVESPFGQGVTLASDRDWVAVPRQTAVNVGAGDFTVAAWIQPKQLRQAGLIGAGKHGWSHGWYLDLPDGQGTLRLEATGPDNQSAGSLSTPPGMIRAGTWQHVAAVVRRGRGTTRLYVNGYAVARGDVAGVNLDNPAADLYFGHIQDAQSFRGELDEVRLYHRALEQAEIQALVEPGRRFVKPPPKEEPQDLHLMLGDREFSGKLTQPAFLCVRLAEGINTFGARLAGTAQLDRIVFTPLGAADELARRFEAFEKRLPRVGVHVGLRRDCGSTLSQVGEAQAVSGTNLSRLVFEGAIRNFPSPEVEKDNVNYLAGVREIGVRSEFTDGRDMPRLLVRSVEFEGPLHDAWPPRTHRNIFIDPARTNDPPSYAREVLRQFASRAFRRPVTPGEESAWMPVFERTYGTTTNLTEGVRDALQVILTSPQFLFIIEKSSGPEPEPLDDHELASKLSYFLWNGPPDSTLMQQANTGSLRRNLEAEVKRLIMDSRFSRFAGEFASQWLALDKFQVLEPDRARYPRLTRDARNHLRQEPVQFIQHLIRNNLQARHLIHSEIVMGNEVVAAYYDLADRTENGFQFLPITHGRSDLGGLLSNAAILAGLSDGRESNPVKRGAWFARRIIAEPPDDPPPNVPALKEETRSLSLRERLEQHRNQPGCAQCHAKIDPWGIPFEEYDAGGRFKAQVVDARSTLPDRSTVAGVRDLKEHLAKDRMDQVAFSFLKHLAIYASGRSLSYNETEFLRQSAASFSAGGYRMQDMVLFVVKSPIFLEK